ncbi:MAG TPA: flagellar basal body-associated FliL family protein [Actinomycetaceae bacterium]|nr:flagellar basal body-associated FliL family protein [Actinomycetaceae bacterium]
MAQPRVIGPGARKIGAKTAATGPPPPPPPAPEPRRRRWRVVLAIAVVLLVAAAGAFFGPRLLADGEDAPAEPEPGAVVAIEPLNVNLAEGRYLRLGFTVQLAAGADELPAAPVTDLAIALYSGRTVEEVNDPARRAELQDELATQLTERFDVEVMAVYYTDFVTQ